MKKVIIILLVLTLLVFLTLELVTLVSMISGQEFLPNIEVQYYKKRLG